MVFSVPIFLWDILSAINAEPSRVWSSERGLQCEHRFRSRASSLHWVREHETVAMGMNGSERGVGVGTQGNASNGKAKAEEIVKLRKSSRASRGTRSEWRQGRWLGRGVRGKGGSHGRSLRTQASSMCRCSWIACF